MTPLGPCSVEVRWIQDLQVLGPRDACTLAGLSSFGVLLWAPPERPPQNVSVPSLSLLRFPTVRTVVGGWENTTEATEKGGCILRVHCPREAPLFSALISCCWPFDCRTCDLPFQRLHFVLLIIPATRAEDCGELLSQFSGVAIAVPVIRRSGDGISCCEHCGDEGRRLCGNRFSVSLLAFQMQCR